MSAPVVLSRTTGIILRLTPYQERDLIVAAISPDVGRLELLARGAREIGAKKYPVLDLFRELTIDYEPASVGTLGKFRSGEIAMDCGALAQSLPLYRFAGKCAAFVLKNAQPELPMALTYDVFRNLLLQLTHRAENAAEGWEPGGAAAVLKLVFLQESGLLPEFSDERTQNFFDALLERAIDGSLLPKVAPEYWTRLNGYLNDLLTRNRIALP